MIPTGNRSRVTQDDPPLLISGMTTVVLDPEGRLVRFSAVAPQVDTASTPKPVDWKPMFDAAGLDFGAFTPAAPQWTPPLYADTRVAWVGPQPGLDGSELRIEAAAYGGKPVYFYPVAPWTTPTRMPETIAQRTQVRWLSVIAQVVTICMFLAAALIARHNIRKGRGDRRGAFKIAAFVSAAALGVWVLDSKHLTDPGEELGRFFEGQPLWAAGLIWLLYLALEPYVRRFWPTTLVSWSRLMAGQYRDPILGRDILFGVGLGALMQVLALLSDYTAYRLGYPTTPSIPDLNGLLGTASVIARTLNQIFNAVVNASFARVCDGAAEDSGAARTAGCAGGDRRDDGARRPRHLRRWIRNVNFTLGVAIVTIIVLTVQRLGLVATLVLFLVQLVMNQAPLTLDTSKWFFGDSLLLMALPAALALYGFYISRGGEPLLGKPVLD